MELECNGQIVDITPRDSLYLAGFANRTGPSTGVHMSLSSRCLIFKMEAAIFCIISNDFMELENKLVTTIKDSIAAQTSIDQSHIFIHSIHTHSAPIMDGMGMATNEANTSYLEETLQKIIANAVSTFKDQIGFKTCTLQVGSSESYIAANRRYFDKNSGKIIISTQDNILEDPTVGILQFVDNKNQVLATLVNYACHPVSLGPQSSLISSDFVGKTRETVEKEWGGICFFLNGAAGDINPRRWPLIDLERTNNLGVSLGKSVLDCTLSPLPFESIKFTKAMIKLPFKIQEIDAKFINTQVSKKKEMNTGFLGWDEKIDQWALEQEKRIGQSEAIDRNVKINVLRIGKTIILFTSGELFSSYHSFLRKQFPEYHIFLVGYTNGESGYLPDEEAISLGGYEVEQAYIFFDEPSSLHKTAPGIYLKKVLALINKVISLSTQLK